MPECGAIPVVGARVMSRFGPRASGQHYGIDLRAREGSPVYAVRAGRVIRAAKNGEIHLYGNTVVIDHGPYLSLSSHLATIDVRGGQLVELGQRIGTVGRTAGTHDNPDGVFIESPPHLHLEFLNQWPVRDGGAGRIDPADAFADLGIIAPVAGPLFSACGEVASELEYPPQRSSGGSDALLLVAALYALSRART